jgi:hypothetical protein
MMMSNQERTWEEERKRLEDFVQKRINKLTKPQQKIIGLMRDNGYVIVNCRDDRGYIKYFSELVNPKTLEVIQKVHPATICSLDPVHIKRCELGHDGELGSIYVTRPLIDYSSLIRAVEMSLKLQREKDRENDNDE